MGYSGENGKRFAAATVCGILAFVVLLASFFTVWYLWDISLEAEKNDAKVEVDMDIEMDLHEAKMILKAEGSGNGTNVDESETEKNDWEDETDSEIADTYITTKYIMMVALILGTLAMIFLIIAGVVGGRNPILRGLPQVLGTLAILITLIAAIYFMTYHPKAWEEEIETDFDESNELVVFMADSGPQESFWGEDSGTIDIEGTPTDTTSEWHPEIGWYLTFVSAALFVISIALHRSAVSEDELSESIRMKRYDASGATGPSTYGTTPGPQWASPEYGQGYQIEQGYEAQAPTTTYGGTETLPVGFPASEPEVVAPVQEPEYTCPTCGAHIRYIEQYERWWCDTCYKYL